MDNDIKIDNLFKKIFENINNPIIDILKNTKEIKTSEKLDEITRYLYKNFNPIQVKDILAKNNIIYDKQDRNFSAKNYNTFTNLIRDIDNNNIITNYSQVNEELFAPPINAYNNNIFSPTSVQKWIGSWDHIEESEFLTNTPERSERVSVLLLLSLSEKIVSRIQTTSPLLIRSPLRISLTIFLLPLFMVTKQSP